MARPRKRPEELHINSVRVNLTDEEMRVLLEISEHTDTPFSIVARRFVVEGIRTELQAKQAA